jgi:hypothetical protein
MYIKLVNSVPEPYSIRQFRLDNPNVSYPKEIPEEYLNEQDVYSYTEDDRPEYDTSIQKLEQSFELRDGSWYKTYTAVNLPQEKVESNIRSMRDRLLQETDWMALSDNTLTQPWADYRQSLRDITDQESFPYSVTWPIEPV